MITLIVYTVLLVESGLAIPVQRLCPPGQYLDEGTGACEHCELICEHAAIQLTTDMCLRHCPGFIVQGHEEEKTVNVKDHAELCPPDTYLDTVILRCEPCADICITDQETDDACSEKCPDFSKPDANKASFPVVELLWAVSVVLGIFSLAMLSLITIRFCFKQRRSGVREDASDAFIQPIYKGTPYIKINSVAEKPSQGIERWLAHLDADDLQEDRYINRSSFLDNKEDPS
ncbi:uncharacterized protein [Haliotis cracherodii]|uniref:uncharacterized protein n=1 Tax=Haliotis cracherodii TaxID=6455 RepID=UPI0039E9A94D